MNMPPLLHYKAYNASNAALTKAAKAVATKTMEDAAAELHHGDDSNQIVKCAVSCDGTWQRRGHSSLNGCVTTLSIETGKCLDIEVLSTRKPTTFGRVLTNSFHMSEALGSGNIEKVLSENRTRSLRGERRAL